MSVFELNTEGVKKGIENRSFYVNRDFTSVNPDDVADGLTFRIGQKMFGTKVPLGPDEDEYIEWANKDGSIKIKLTADELKLYKKTSLTTPTMDKIATGIQDALFPTSHKLALLSQTFLKPKGMTMAGPIAAKMKEFTAGKSRRRRNRRLRTTRKHK